MRPKLPKILVTGGAGFIGSEFVRQAARQSYPLTVVDKLTYSGDLERLREVKGHFSFHKTDIGGVHKLESIFKKERPKIVIHFAAQTHVDRSILDPVPFIQANIIGTQNLINLSLKYKARKFIHISTDEVYGESQKGRFVENAPLKPNNPYAATKASAELLIKAAVRTHGLPAIIIRPSNNYGPWQYPEKFIPVIILKALKNENVPVYGKGRQIREWLHVADCNEAILLILNKGKIGETYNIGSTFEADNLTTCKTLLRLLGKGETVIQFVKDRPGHDFRYSVDSTKLRKLGWKPKHSFKKGIQQTVGWYQKNYGWLKSKHSFLKKYWKKIYKKY